MGKAVAAVQPEWQKIEARDGDEAIALLEQEGVDVTFVDFNMPGRNGLEVAEAIRARYPAMPIALATANVQDEIIAKVRAIDGSFVPKPVSSDGLRGFLSGAALKLHPKK